jgi:ribosome-associated translation inhibitor RaiA
MYTKIQTQGFDLTAAIEARVEQQVNRALGRFGDDVLAVDVYLSDVNGPRGGSDKKALMRASLRGLPPISVSTEHRDLYVAISRNAKRMRRALGRALRKSRRIESRRVVGLRRLLLDPAPN